MNFIFLLSLLILPTHLPAEVNDFRKVKLSQVDYRRRVGVRFDAASIARLRLRTYLEYRYKPKSIKGK